MRLSALCVRRSTNCKLVINFFLFIKLSKQAKLVSCSVTLLPLDGSKEFYWEDSVPLTSFCFYTIVSSVSIISRSVVVLISSEDWRDHVSCGCELVLTWWTTWMWPLTQSELLTPDELCCLWCLFKVCIRPIEFTLVFCGISHITC